MDLSIITVSWNTKDLLRRCLASITTEQAGAANPLKFETIVVDNQSGDGSAEMVRNEFPAVTLIESGGNLGFARGCNVGLRKATAPLVLFLNPDTEVMDCALQKMVHFMRDNPQVGALSCKVMEPDGTPFGPGLQWFPSPFAELFKYFFVSQGTLKWIRRCVPLPDPLANAEVTKLYGTCMLVRREVLTTVGSFDEEFFMYCEDVDLSRRICKAGWKLYYLSDASILHLGGAAADKVPGRFSILMMCDSICKLMHKHYGVAGSLGYRLAAIIGSVFRLGLLGTLMALRLIGIRGGKVHPQIASRKYLTTLQWAVGLQKPTIPS